MSARGTILRGVFTATAAALFATAASAQPSGQRAFGQATVEPAYDDQTGALIYLLTPEKAPLPSKANPRAVSPLYLVAYPDTTTIDPGTLNCQPHNCGHVNVLPFPAPGYTNGGASCTDWGLPANSCGLLAGHDHLVGLPQTGGDWNIAWQVHLIVFTPKGFQDGAIDRHLLTEDDLFGTGGVVTNADAVDIPTDIVFNCSLAPEAIYLKATPLSF